MSTSTYCLRWPLPLPCKKSCLDLCQRVRLSWHKYIFFPIREEHHLLVCSINRGAILEGDMVMWRVRLSHDAELQLISSVKTYCATL
mmetsp:Transcript_6961/g.15368  ORF Transcript_6961/g.15368 Transcript_6961/m.15368 type:complete len:87 (-) Transcript_6961:1039-1299(-)